MNYIVKAFKIIRKGPDTTLEEYEKEVPNYSEGVKEENRLRSLGEYVNISIHKIKVPHLN